MEAQDVDRIHSTEVGAGRTALCKRSDGWGMGADQPHMPAAKPSGRPREIELRAVLDAILYIARTGCQWRMLAKDFPPFTTVQGYFYEWRDDGLFEKINFALLLQAREAAVRKASPSAGVIDSQSAKITES